jgi:hypothetical protein
MAGTVHPLTIMPDGSFAPVIKPTTYTVTKTLAADTAEYITVPAGAKYAVFGASTSFMARYNATAAGTDAASFGDQTPDNAHEMNPTQRFLQGVAEISVISKAACELSVTFYSI